MSCAAYKKHTKENALQKNPSLINAAKNIPFGKRKKLLTPKVR